MTTNLEESKGKQSLTQMKTRLRQIAVAFSFQPLLASHVLPLRVLRQSLQAEEICLAMRIRTSAIVDPLGIFFFFQLLLVLS